MVQIKDWRRGLAQPRSPGNLPVRVRIRAGFHGQIRAREGKMQHKEKETQMLLKENMKLDKN